MKNETDSVILKQMSTVQKWEIYAMLNSREFENLR